MNTLEIRSRLGPGLGVTGVLDEFGQVILRTVRLESEAAQSDSKQRENIVSTSIGSDDHHQRPT